MKAPFVRIPGAARRELNAHVLWLRAEAGKDVAERFANAAIASFEKLAATPLIGPAIASRDTRLAGLRKWKVEGFPRMLIFYQSHPGGVRIIRILHAAQDWWSLLDLD